MADQELHMLPVACINPEVEEEVLLPEYLLTAEEAKKGIGTYKIMETVEVFVRQDTFDRLLGDDKDPSVYLEIVLSRDQGKRVSLNEILYPDQVAERMKEDDEIRQKIQKAGEALGITHLQVFSFAEEYHRSFFQGGKGMEILLVAAVVSASWVAAVLVILQKDAACLRRRKKEFALLLTIGMTRGKIFKMVFVEHLLYAFVGIAAGIPLSLFFLSGIYEDGGARQMASAWDVPADLGGLAGGPDLMRSVDPLLLYGQGIKKYRRDLSDSEGGIKMAQVYGIRAEKISKTYGTKEHPVRALKEISLQILPGQFAAVLGPSGCGKSTLLHVLGGIDEPDQGNVEIKGKKLYEMKRSERSVFRRRNIGMVYQAIYLLPSLNIEENIILPLLLDGRKVSGEWLKALLTETNLRGKKHALPSQLSGGQRKGPPLPGQ